MKTAEHLRLEQATLWPGQEWLNEEPSWRFVRIQSGPAYWLGEPDNRNFNESEIVVVAPGAKAVIRASQLGDVIMLRFIFQPELLFGFFTLAERHFLERSKQQRDRAIWFFPSTHPLSGRFAALAQCHPSKGELAERAELLGLSAAFFCDALDVTPHVSNGVAIPGQFDQIVGEMPDAEFIHYQLEQLAEMCHCSPRHFTRLFHKRFGSSPRERQLQLRLQLASRLLLETDKKIGEIAVDSGYHSHGLFNGLFKKRFGMSPHEWRNAAKNTGAEIKPNHPPSKSS